jgi:hypothetical protein
MVLGGIGISITEQTTESYFFKIIKKEDRDKFYGPYNTIIDLSAITANLICAGILWFFPYKYVFLFFSAMMFIFALLSTKAKKGY